jgi:large subunit ribosomal protein L25
MAAILEATVRDTFGKNEARRTRQSGRVPGVVYGGVSGATAQQTTPVAVDPKVLRRILHAGANTLITLRLTGQSDTPVIVKEFQLDPITHAVLHADFYRVAMDKAIQVTVPVALKGEPKGVKQQGGLVEFVRREIEVECLPGDIPESIEIDITELLVHQGVRVRDIATSTKWKPLSDLDLLLVHVIVPRAEEEPAPAEAAATAAPEPEIIKKGKKEEEGDEKEKK